MQPGVIMFTLTGLISELVGPHIIRVCCGVLSLAKDTDIDCHDEWSGS